MEQLLLTVLFKQMFKYRFTIYLFSNVLLDKTKNLNNDCPIHCQGLSPTNLLIEKIIWGCWYIILNINIYFQFLNNITYIFIHFFTHTYFQKNWNLLFKQTYQIGPIYHTICTLYHSCLKWQTIIYCISLSHRPSFFLYRYQSSTSNSNEKVCVKQ